MQSQVVLEPCSAPFGLEILAGNPRLCAMKPLPPSFSHWEKLFPGALGYWERVQGAVGGVDPAQVDPGCWDTGIQLGGPRGCASSSFSPSPLPLSPHRALRASQGPRASRGTQGLR